jgi:hypothetical protein
MKQAIFYSKNPKIFHAKLASTSLFSAVLPNFFNSKNNAPQIMIVTSLTKKTRG